MTRSLARAARGTRSEEGFTLIIAIGVLFVTSLLLLAVFTTVHFDSTESHHSVVEQQAYYAALAGVQEYEYKLETNPNYWEGCETLAHEAESGERYEVAIQPAASKSISNCKTSPFETVIESSGLEANTFRVVSTGCAGKTGITTCPTEKELKETHDNLAVRRLVATFKVTGFLNYLFFTQYEDVDPRINGTSEVNCAKYYEENGVKRSSECTPLLFVAEDSVKGPMHTDDSTEVSCTKELSFGREKHEPPDEVEINGGTWPTCSAGSEPTYNTLTKTYSKGPELIAPESDESLAAYVEPEFKFEGVIKIYMNGFNNQLGIYSYVNGVWTPKVVNWPSNGLIYDQNSTKEACKYTFTMTENDTPTTAEIEKLKPCGTVYVEGSYNKSLTVAGQNVVVTGNTYPTSVSITEGSAPPVPTGTGTLGLIATEFVRVYHPCTGSNPGVNQSGILKEPYIYAAILSTSHSFTVDNYACGEALKKLHVYGAIAQKFRGPVGTGNGKGTNYTGYLKEYVYDPRLAAEEPPYFLSPLKTGWKVARLTATQGG